MDSTKVIEQVLTSSKADETIVIVTSHDKTNLRWANSGLTTNGREHHTYIAVISVIDKRVGTYVSTLNKATDLSKLVKKSASAALESPKAQDYMPLVKGSGRWSKSQTAKTDEPGGLAENLGQVFASAGQNKWQMFGYSELGRTDYWVGTSAGARKHYSHVQGQLELNAKSSDFKKSVWAGMPLKSFSEADALGLYKRLEQKMKWSKKSIELPAGKYEVILEPSAAADMMLFAYWMSSARTAEEGHSAYSAPGGTVIGQQMYNQNVSVYSDPAEPGLEVAPFDITYATSQEESVFDNAVELKKTDWIKNGTQKHLMAPRYVAKRHGYSRPAPFIPNLIFKANGPSLDDMIASTKNGLLITTFWYMREVDPQNLLVTGLTRDGVFLIKNGQVQGAVNNFRFNMSPLAMLKQIEEIGKSQHTLAREFGDYFPLTHMPALRVKDFNMSSVSKAK
ncbi:MAG TPA: TldD/PmbA family protein [Candidatus Saccharimonadales bacterium]